MSNSTKPIHVLRSLLRQVRPGRPLQDAVPTTTTSSSSSTTTTTTTTTQAFILQQYRANQGVECPEKVSRLRQLAFDFLTLRQDIQERERLYELDASAETLLSPQEMSRRAAARAGLALPENEPKQQSR